MQNQTNSKMAGNLDADYEIIDYFSLQEDDAFCICDICGKKYFSGNLEVLQAHLKIAHKIEAVQQWANLYLTTPTAT